MPCKHTGLAWAPAGLLGGIRTEDVGVPHLAADGEGERLGKKRVTGSGGSRASEGTPHRARLGRAWLWHL